MKARHTTWIVVLAGGSGSRLSSITRTAGGVAIPKQYCSLRGERSLLLDTLHRALCIVPATNIMIVVAAEHEQWWAQQLAGFPAANILVQPSNRGTGADVLLAVAAIRARSPRARIAVMPSDHFIELPAVVVASLLRALDHVVADPDRVVLLGITPDAPDCEYGWIIPGDAEGRFKPVIRFVEKPPPLQAIELLRIRALWHSFILAFARTRCGSWRSTDTLHSPPRSGPCSRAPGLIRTSVWRERSRGYRPWTSPGTSSRVPSDDSCSIRCRRGVGPTSVPRVEPPSASLASSSRLVLQPPWQRLGFRPSSSQPRYDHSPTTHDHR